MNRPKQRPVIAPAPTDHPAIRAAVREFETVRARRGSEPEPEWKRLCARMRDEWVALLILDGVVYLSDHLHGEMCDSSNDFGARRFPVAYVLNLDSEKPR